MRGKTDAEMGGKKGRSDEKEKGKEEQEKKEEKEKEWRTQEKKEERKERRKEQNKLYSIKEEGTQPKLLLAKKIRGRAPTIEHQIC